MRSQTLTVLSCVTADSTGTHSLYTTYKDYELMFHVSTMLPYTPNNRQQVSETVRLKLCPLQQTTMFAFIVWRAAV